MERISVPTNILAIILCISILVTRVCSSTCPTQCTCREETRQNLGQVYSVRCSKEKLTEVPRLRDLVSVALPKFIDLSSNNIISISKTDFLEGLKVVSLDLSKNEKLTIETDAFIHMADSLKHLSLENIGLVFDKPLVILDRLKHLEFLSLSNNNRKGYVPGAQEDVTVELLNSVVGGKLKRLKMSSCGLRSMSLSSLDQLTHLKEIDLSNNWFISVPEAIKPLKSLETLLLSHCNIKIIDNFAFENLSKLKFIDMNSNKIEDIRVEAFKGLETSLKKLNLERCGMIRFPTNSLRNLAKLKYLDVSKNFRSLEVNAFSGVYCLETLLIGSVGLTFWDYSFDEQSDCIQDMTIKHMKLSKVPLNALKRLNKLVKLVLDHNSFTTLPKQAFNGIKANFISIANNPLSKIEKYAFSGLPPNLDLNLRRTHISDIDFLTGYPEGAIKSVNLDYALIECRCSMKSSLNVTQFVEVYGTCRRGEKSVPLISSLLPNLLDEACKEEHAVNSAHKTAILPFDNWLLILSIFFLMASTNYAADLISHLSDFSRI